MQYANASRVVVSLILMPIDLLLPDPVILYY